jgi:opacity protein-like surface antigen
MSVGVLALASLLVTSTPARGDWLFTPYIGMNFGGDADFGDVGDFEDNFEKKVVFGGSAAWMGAGVIGAEVDFGWSPNFFEMTTGDDDFDFGESNLTTLMGNVIVGAPVGGTSGRGVRPYGAVGVGLMRSAVGTSELLGDLTANDFGFNIGAGVVGFFSDHVGLRGDVRYFRSFEDNESDRDLDLGVSDFSLWRATVGVTFRFGD